jgi:hypothetical protein
LGADGDRVRPARPHLHGAGHHIVHPDAERASGRGVVTSGSGCNRTQQRAKPTATATSRGDHGLVDLSSRQQVRLTEHKRSQQSGSSRPPDSARWATLISRRRPRLLRVHQTTLVGMGTRRPSQYIPTRLPAVDLQLLSRV